MISHIDDLLHGGDQLFEDTVLKPLIGRFLAGRIQEKCFTYVGFQISQLEDFSITISLSDYVSKYQPLCIGIKSSSELAGKEEQKEFRQVVGRLNWVAQGARPDFFFEVIDLSMKLKQPSIKNLKDAKKSLRKLMDCESDVKFSTLLNDLHFIVYTDAALGNLSDGVSSPAGILVFLSDGVKNSCPLSWRANKIRRVVRSTLAAETMALQEGIDEALYLQRLFTELMPSQKFPIDVYTDNQGVVDAICSTKLVDDRRLRLDMGSLKQTFERDVRKLVWIPSSLNLANCLTKKGACSDGLLQVFHSGKFL